MAELIVIDAPLKHTFYEVECVRGNWFVRELKRQIGSLLYMQKDHSLIECALATMRQSVARKGDA